MDAWLSARKAGAKFCSRVSRVATGSIADLAAARGGRTARRFSVAIFRRERKLAAEGATDAEIFMVFPCAPSVLCGNSHVS